MQEINDDNCKQALFDYSQSNHTPEGFKEAIRGFPYDVSELDDEFALKDCMEWFMLEWKNPKTGKTIVREFTERVNMDEEMKAKMLQMEQLRFGSFEVVESGDVFIKIRDKERGEVLIVKLYSKQKSVYPVGRMLSGRIHPWGDVYRFAGIMRMIATEEERFNMLGLVHPDTLIMGYENSMIRKAENMQVYRNSSMASMLNKYHSQWVDGICKSLGINTRGRKRDKAMEIAYVLNSDISRIFSQLPERSKEALAFVMKNGGLVKYSKLSKRYNDDINFWWNEDPPESDMGILRSHGLLFIGKMAMNERMYKVALVPEELRDKLNSLLAQS